MYCANLLSRLLVIAALTLSITACNLEDDLLPSDKDKRSTVVSGSTGNMTGQIAKDFTSIDSLGKDFILSDYLSGGSKSADAIVLYFTMWCPVCLSHSDHIYNTVIPQFRGRGNTAYALVDFVSGSVEATRATELANGYASSDFISLSDVSQQLLEQFNGSMGIIVIIDGKGNIILNEDYRNGSASIEKLDIILP